MSLDADLEIGLVWDRTRQGFKVSLRFDVPGTNTDDWLAAEQLLVLDLPRLESLRVSPSSYAEALSEMVMGHDDIAAYYQRARAWIDARQAHLHLRLHISAPAPLHAVWWECLDDPGTGTPVATQDRILLSRYLSSNDWRPVAVRPVGSKRALLVVAGPEDVDRYSDEAGNDLSRVDKSTEIVRVRNCLRGYQVEEIGGELPATLENLLRALEHEFDVLYLVCHGILEEDVPRLLLETEDGRADLVDGRRLVERLAELDKRPALAVLSSCQSAGNDATRDEGALAALGPRLASAGLAAVLAMQGNVTASTASLFGEQFFSAFAEHGIVDRAAAAARRALAAADRPDWWVPVLFSRLRSGRTYYRPAFAERAETSWQNLELMIRRERLTPVLGPGLADAILGSRQDVARRWVRRWQMPIAVHNQGDLAQVAQYLRVSHAQNVVREALIDHLRTELLERMRRAHQGEPYDLSEDLVVGTPEQALHEVGRRQRAADPGEPYRVLAAVPAAIYVTTGWTDLLQDALMERMPKRTPTTLMFPWNARYGMRQPELLEEPTVAKPLVYHLFGRLEEPRSLVLTEDDYFTWLKAWIERRDTVPPVVKEALTLRSLLFLGYRLDDWDFRVVFQSIKSFEGSEELLRENLHAGVQLSPENQAIEPESAQEYLESYFGKNQISIYWGNTRTFLDELRERTGIAT